MPVRRKPVTVSQSPITETKVYVVFLCCIIRIINLSIELLGTKKTLDYIYRLKFCIYLFIYDFLLINYYNASKV